MDSNLPVLSTGLRNLKKNFVQRKRETSKVNSLSNYQLTYSYPLAILSASSRPLPLCSSPIGFFVLAARFYVFHHFITSLVHFSLCSRFFASSIARLPGISFFGLVGYHFFHLSIQSTRCASSGKPASFSLLDPPVLSGEDRLLWNAKRKLHDFGCIHYLSRFL